MYRAFTWLYLALSHAGYSAPRRLARAATLAVILSAALGLVFIDSNDRMTAGPVTEAHIGEAGERSILRVDLPGLSSTVLALDLDPLYDDVRPGRTWILVYGEQATNGPYQYLDVNRFRVFDARPEPRDWIPDAARTTPWILVAAGIAVLTFAAHAQVIATAAAMAGLSAAICWHALHMAEFFGFVSDVFFLEPVITMVGAVLGASLGTSTVVAAPAGITVRLAAAAVTFLLLPWSVETLSLPAEYALLVIPLCFCVPALLPALAATLLVSDGLGHESPDNARLILGGAAIIALLITRYNHIADHYTLSHPLMHSSDKRQVVK